MKNNFYSNKPLLSILVPTYEYPEGVVRILSSIDPSLLDKCEVLIGDNSSSCKVKECVDALRKSLDISFSYTQHNPPIGPVQNWNFLLDRAKGRYSILMHHDEFPVSENFFNDLISKIQLEEDSDIYVLNCILINPLTKVNISSMPAWLKHILCKLSPEYAYRRNFIGPTAAFVCKTELYPRFDRDLQWFVDVDLYVRALKKAKKIVFYSQIKVGSLLGRVDSITAMLASSLSDIKRKERAYLAMNRSLGYLWVGSNLICKVTCGIEFFFWSSMRLLSRLIYLMGCYPLTQKEVIRALNPARPERKSPSQKVQ